VTFLEANLNVRFKPGKFSCSPPVWQTNFPLHPRVKQTQGGHHGGSIALHALKNVLNAFAVTNRSNMFVYRDAEGNIFYIKIAEIISALNSRKVTAPPGKKSQCIEMCSILSYCNVLHCSACMVGVGQVTVLG